MARGEGEIDGPADVPAQSAEEEFVTFQAAKVLSFSARQSAQGSGAGTSPNAESPAGQR